MVQLDYADLVKIIAPLAQVLLHACHVHHLLFFSLLDVFKLVPRLTLSSLMTAYAYPVQQ